MKDLLLTVVPDPIVNRARHSAQVKSWEASGYAMPCPHRIKQATLLRNGVADGTWVETGTYMGDTTALLARTGRAVHTVEPEPTLAARARQRFQGSPVVTVHEGTSEAVFPSLLPGLSGDISFWLDGHFSAGVTYKGEQDTPIREELASIAANLHRFARCRVMIDDIRLFDPTVPEFAGYPSLDWLVDWVRDSDMRWHIENDIFVARNG